MKASAGLGPNGKAVVNRLAAPFRLPAPPRKPAPKPAYVPSSPVVRRYKVNVRHAAARPGDQGSIDFFNNTDGYSGPTVVIYGKPGKVPAKDIEGDIVSHYLARGVDPVLTGFYKRFVSSMTPQQKANLRDQYAWARAHGGETRPFAAWADAAGIPAYFRGYAFRQWSNPKHWYTKQQLEMFDAMVSYLKTGYQV